MIDLSIKWTFDVDRTELNQHLPYDEPLTSEEMDKLKDYFEKVSVDEDGFMNWDVIRENMIRWFAESDYFSEIRSEIR